MIEFLKLSKIKKYFYLLRALEIGDRNKSKLHKFIDYIRNKIVEDFSKENQIQLYKKEKKNTVEELLDNYALILTIVVKMNTKNCLLRLA